ncbi:MAG: cytochrome c oxidase cbb3-type subunit [Chloroflexota bacterium]|jgi:cbb3-type cytochrome c oxidase subunit II|nr:cytochrome c oxidase cbb3-type subunit [Chloroflexota bacterium]
MTEVGPDVDEGRLDDHPRVEQSYAREGSGQALLMSPHLVAIGGLLAFFTVVLAVVVLPTATYNPPPSPNWVPLTNAEVRGRAHFLANGCVYCHSDFTRPQDVFVGNNYLYKRISLPGDYYGEDQSPNTLGTQRTGPDLAQEGGVHPAQWHVAHYANPRNVDPLSIMPDFSFLSESEAADLIAYNQSQGGKAARLRESATTIAQELEDVSGGTDPATYFPDLVTTLTADGQYRPDGQPTDTDVSGLAWADVYDLNTFERSYWLTQDPLQVTQENLNRGRSVFVARCSGCHGVQGLGDGPAAALLNPQPDNFSDPTMFTSPTDSDGQRYHRILTGGRGSAMEDFGTRLSVEDIWRVIHFLRTIPNGGFQEPLTTTGTYEAWAAPKELLSYVDAHPIAALQPVIADITDPFMAATRWLLGGMGPDDTIYVGGKLPISLDRVAALIRERYVRDMEQRYSEAAARGETLPSKESILSTQDLVFAEP